LIGTQNFQYGIMVTVLLLKTYFIINPLILYLIILQEGLSLVESIWFFNINNYPATTNKNVTLADARTINKSCDFWITDPPYADAVHYHELSELFLAWDRKFIQKCFPEWYTDSKRGLSR
jgi:hypothetical protein